MAELIPLHDYVVIQEADAVVEESATSKAGLILLEGTVDEEIKSQGKVIKLPVNSTGTLSNSIPFNEGDYVVFKRHMFEDVVIAKNRYLMGKIENVIAVIKV